MYQFYFGNVNVLWSGSTQYLRTFAYLFNLSMLGLQTELRGDVVLVKHLCNKMQTAMNDLINNIECQVQL